MLAFPLQALAETTAANNTPQGEIYIKSLKLIEGQSELQAKTSLENAGYTFVARNLNEGTDGGAV